MANKIQRFGIRATVRLGLSALIPFAVIACGHGPRFAYGYCENRVTGQAGPAEYDASWASWTGRDENGISFTVHSENSPQWKCRKGGNRGE